MSRDGVPVIFALKKRAGVGTISCAESTASTNTRNLNGRCAPVAFFKGAHASWIVNSVKAAAQYAVDKGRAGISWRRVHQRTLYASLNVHRRRWPRSGYCRESRQFFTLASLCALESRKLIRPGFGPRILGVQTSSLCFFWSNWFKTCCEA